MNLDIFFKPKTVAIIGASTEKGSIGFVLTENFVKGKYRGKIFPINPKRKKVLGKKCYSSVLDVKEKIDLAIIATPAKVVPIVLEQCMKKKVKSVEIISAGFSEIGEKELTKKLDKLIEENPNTPVVGPNVLGHLYMKKGVDSMFNPPSRSPRPPNGSVSFISQSGALGAAMLDWAADKNYGINKFVSYGNARGVDEADFFEYFAKDKETKVLLFYIEGVKDGRKFFETARKTAKKMPVIFIKGGTTEKGAKATMSHTGSLAGSYEVYKAMFRQTGIIHAEDLKDAFDFGKIFVTEPKPKGKKIQIITNGGGFGVLATDAILEAGLELAEMSSAKRKAIEKISPKYAVIKNPMDLVGDSDNQRYKVAIKNALADKNVNALLIILLPQTPKLTNKIAEDIAKVLKNRKKPAVIMVAGGKFAGKKMDEIERHKISVFSSPFKAANSLKALIDFHENQK